MHLSKIGVAVLAFLTVGLIYLPATAAENTIKLTVGLAHKDPNTNILKNAGDIKWTQELTNKFQEQYPNVDIEWQFVAGDKMITQIVAGGGPDIINDEGGGFHDMGVQGMFYNLNSYMERYNFNPFKQGLFWEPQWSAFQFKGNQFAFPQYLGTMAMWYNAEMLAARGLAMPSASSSDNSMTWDTFRALLKRLRQDNNGDGKPEVYGLSKAFYRDRQEYWLVAGGAHYYTDGVYNGTKSALDSEEAIHSLEYLRSLIDEGLIGGNWYNSTAGVLEEHSGSLWKVLGNNANGTLKVPFDWNIFPMPIGPSGKRATLATTDGYGINVNSKNPDMAFQLLRFLSSDTANSILAKYLGLQPANRKAVPNYIKVMGAVNTSVRSLDIHVHTDAGAYAYPQSLYPNEKVAGGILADAYKRILTNANPEPANSVMRDAVRRINQINEDGSVTVAK